MKYSEKKQTIYCKNKHTSMKSNLIKTLFLLSLNLFLFGAGNAQTTVGIAGKYGNFIYTGRELPKGENTKKILRENTAIAKLEFPESAEEFVNKVHRFYAENPYYLQVSDSLLINYWQWACGFSFVDSLPIVARQPDVLYGLGIVYFDPLNDENKNGTVKYTLVKNNGSRNEISITQPAGKRIPTLKSKGYTDNDNNILLSWSYPNGNDLLMVNTYKQHVGQDAMHLFAGISFLMNLRDTIEIRVMDTSVIKGLTYKYTIQAIDKYGYEFLQADTVKLMHIPKNSLPVLLKAKTQSDDVKKGIKLSWQLQNKYAVQTLDIYRSLYFDSAYSYLSTVSADDTTFEDFSVKPVTAYWYKIVINGVFERGINTAKITGILKKDATPLAVNQFKATAEEKGIRLSWVNSTTEARGFYVYRANGYKGELKQISSLIRVEKENDVFSFLDSGKNLEQGTPYSYAIKVLSKGYVQSDFSARSSASYAGRESLPPLTDLKATVDGKRILLFWRSLRDIYPALGSYKIYRSLATEDKFRLLYEQGSEENRYIDSSAETGVNYRYKVVPVSVSGVEGPYATIEAEIEAPNIISPEITSIYYTANSVHLEVAQNLQEGISEVEIWKIESGKNAVKAGALKKGENTFTDSAVSKGKTYYYYTVAKAYGKEAQNSVPAKVVIE